MTAISRLLRSIIIGPPGSGKGTISERIVKDFGNVHLSSGDILRENIRSQTDIGKKAKRYIENGSLVPDAIMVDLICSELQKLKGESWLLDGYPRTVDQAKALMVKEPVDTVLYLNVPFSVIIERIRGRLLHPGSGRTYHTEFNPPRLPMKDDVTGEPLVQRDDDKPETVMARLQGFQNQTQPVLDFYRNHGLLEEFKGKYSNEIWPEVHTFLSTKVEPIRFTKYA